MERIYYNGIIHTMSARNEKEELEHTPEAVLIKEGKILKVGKEEEIFSAAHKNAQKYDLGGKCLMPSFIDAHSHFLMNSQLSLCADLSDCNSFDEIITTLKKYIHVIKIKNGQAVLGFGYDHNFLKENAQPDKRVLDKVSTDIPIFILHISGHLACANSAAMKLAAITADTPNPPGGVIGRLDGSGEPSGYLEEAGMRTVQAAIAPHIKVNPMKLIKQMKKAYLENGVTTVQDGATAGKDIKLLAGMAKLRILNLDVVSYPMIADGGAEIINKYTGLFGSYKNHLKIGGYKIILDGSPQGRSAWMSEPYLGEPADYCGYPWMKDEDVNRYVEQAVREHRQILAHCNGDAASEQFLNAYENAIAKAGIRDDLRPVMIHCQTVRNDQLDRMAKLNMIASVFVGHVWYWGDVHLKNFGSARGNHISPVKDAIKRGIHVNFHQDTPVTKPDMLHSIWCAVNRRSRAGNVIGENQKIDVYDAMRAVTIEAAYEYFEEDSKGTIEQGKRADLVILDRSPLLVDPMEIKDIKVLETIKDGKVIFQRGR